VSQFEILYCNFVCIHKTLKVTPETLKVTPAMAVCVFDRLWSMENIDALINARHARKRARRRKSSTRAI
jgi:hypothetical protein